MSVIAWDFDGVLNANVRDGRFIWADAFEADTGQSLAVFKEHVFHTDFDRVITGHEDLRDRVAVWADAVGYAPGADALLAYWFERDFFPDAEVLELVDRLSAAGVTQVLATNNEWRRAELISQHPAFGPRMDRIFASGPMGVCKPDAGFFEAVHGALGVAASEILLVDDLAANVAAAERCGWRAYHLTDATRRGLRAALAEATGAVL